MRINNKALLSINSWSRIDNTLQINKTDTNYIARFCIYIVIVTLLLMAGNASSGVMDDIKADMQLNEAPLLNTPGTRGWKRGAIIHMGNAPRGDATPSWWTPGNLEYKSTLPWNAIIPWFVIYPGVNNAATNVRVKVFGITLFLLEKSTNQWKKIDTGLGNPTWAKNMNFALNSSANSDKTTPRLEPDGTLSYKLNTKSNPIHGGMPKQDFTKYGIDPSDVAAVFAHLKTQLILDDPAGIDDRTSAQILVSIGADFSPTETTAVLDYSPMKYSPSIAASRFGLVRTSQRNHYMATIDPPGSIKTESEYVLNGGVVTIPAHQFEANMPPYLVDTIAPSAPTSLQLKKIEVMNYVTATLSWEASSDNVAVAGYNIYADETKVGESALTNYADTLRTATGSVYSITVKAFDYNGNLSTSSDAVLLVY